MPMAQVRGFIHLDNGTLIVNGTEYHDHNWGRWSFNDPQWNWAQVSIPGDNLSTVLGEIIGSGRNTVLGVQYDGKIAKFTNRQVNLSVMWTSP